jgi:6-phosphogluconolactonase
MISRRRLVALLAAVPLDRSLPAAAQWSLSHRRPAPSAQPFVYIGTDTARTGARGIYVCRFDTAKGQLTTPVLAAPTLRPAFLADNRLALKAPAPSRRQALRALGQTPPAPERHLLYATNEGDAKTSGVSTFAIDPATGALRFLSQVSAGGDGPCFIDVDATGRSAYVANYAGGTIASYRVLPDGTLSDPGDRVDFHHAPFGAHGPHKNQNGPHPHSSMISPDNRFLVVNDLGLDIIALFPIDPATAHLGKPQIFRLPTPGSGPRHAAFHPNERWLYGIDELSSHLDQYLFTSTHGPDAQAILTNAGHSVSTVDPGFHGTNAAAELAIASTGDFLYASNRGENTLVVFAIDPGSGALSLRQRIACGGSTPRQFTLDPTERWLVCGNQDSASLTVFARDPGTGRLTGPGQTVALESPMYTLFV